MRIVSSDTNKLVIHNRRTSSAQERWATAILGIGMIAIYFLASKVATNIFYLWLGILSHGFCFMLVCWYFAPVITTFDKVKGTVLIERFSLFATQVTEHSLSDITSIQIKKTEPINVLSAIYLVLTPGKRVYLSNWDNKKQCQEVLGIIKKFLAL